MDNSFVKNHFVGRDGFIWWIGQVADEEVWKGNIPGFPLADNSDNPGFAERSVSAIVGTAVFITGQCNTSALSKTALAKSALAKLAVAKNLLLAHIIGSILLICIMSSIGGKESLFIYNAQSGAPDFLLLGLAIFGYLKAK